MAVRGPLTPRETRLIQYLHSTQDVFFPYGTWPGYLRDMILLPHKDNRQRFTLFFFLVANGLNPHVACLWALLIDVRPVAGEPRLILGQYDEEAQRQMRQMKRDVRNEKFFKGTKPMMDMTLGRVINM